jgi:hypothetical protein
MTLIFFIIYTNLFTSSSASWKWYYHLIKNKMIYVKESYEIHDSDL